VINEADLLLIDNGATNSVKDVIDRYYCHAKIYNKENIFVNPAWNRIMAHFLHGSWDKLIIMNSDIIMKQGWSKHLTDDFIPIVSDGTTQERKVVTEGTPGVFICLTREMVNIIYPIPDYIKVWFGDEYIFTVLRELGYQTIIIPELIANHYHGGSQNVQKVPGISEIIEEDKANWAKYGLQDVQNRVYQIQQQRLEQNL
jgi:hypothetical protein